MKYNFDEIIPRRGTNSYKWDTPEEENVLPMWVADMDFRTAPAIIETLRRRVEHGIFGYTKVPQNYYDTIVKWFINRHQWEIDSQWIIYTSGVVPAISAIIKAMTIPGDKIIVQTPVYNCFYSSIRNNGCKMIANNLIYHATQLILMISNTKLPIQKQNFCCYAIRTIRSDEFGHQKNYSVSVIFVCKTEYL